MRDRGDDGRTWLVTGGTRGLGAHIARVALENGEHVVVAGRDPSRAVGLIEAFPGRALALPLDVTDRAGIAAMRESIGNWTGRVDVLVNNAGQGLLGAVEEASDEEVRRLFDVNLFGILEIIRQFLPDMRTRRSGRVINVGSVAGFVANPGTGLYCATKFALEAVSEALRKEVAGLGINVSCVAPGGMRTDFNGASIWPCERRIDDYADTAQARADDLRKRAGLAGSDPRLVAEAIWRLSNDAAPPAHLILGGDAIERVAAKLEIVAESLSAADALDSSRQGLPRA